MAEIGIAVPFPGFDQLLPDALEQAHLGIDYLGGGLKMPQVFFLGIIEQSPQEAAVQVDDLVEDGGHALNGESYEDSVLAYMAFPEPRRVKPHSSSPLNRLNKDEKRRAGAVGTFPMNSPSLDSSGPSSVAFLK